MNIGMWRFLWLLLSLFSIMFCCFFVFFFFHFILMNLPSTHCAFAFDESFFFLKKRKAFLERRKGVVFNFARFKLHHSEGNANLWRKFLPVVSSARDRNNFSSRNYYYRIFSLKCYSIRRK